MYLFYYFLHSFFKKEVVMVEYFNMCYLRVVRLDDFGCPYVVVKKKKLNISREDQRMRYPKWTWLYRNTAGE